MTWALSAEMHTGKEQDHCDNNKEPFVKRVLDERRSPGSEEHEGQHKARNRRVFIVNAPDDLHTGMNEGEGEIFSRRVSGYSRSSIPLLYERGIRMINDSHSE
jgi:hypothetical protein